MITKQFLKSKSLCKVTFTLPKEAVEAATEVAVMGEFNNWDLENPVSMKKQKDGSFKTTLELETGKEYAFRYLLDGVKWENDNAADKYVATPFGSENSVVIAMN
ncbi:MAG: isoamylase early set domain-containing protein [Saprospirales bacterium]|nr:isoamylase early set domain-containing protein [Saprospirales bacterium]MBK6902125.1 isoamylase early set domain-containing protein [Saprospirales bacterium]MBK7337986.1 isoamylase early set domain-containing protein [Saprospirales bacterium]